MHGRFFLLGAAQGAQIDQDIDKGVLIGDGTLVAQVWPLNAEGNGLAVNPFHGAALIIEALKGNTLAVKFMASTGPDTGG